MSASCLFVMLRLSNSILTFMPNSVVAIGFTSF
nr:MAG TPA: hypothetical protein [Caudoviricetes sp.]